MTTAEALELPADGVEAMTREERRAYLWEAAGRLAATRAEGYSRLAKMLHVSDAAVESWLKPERSKSSRPAPAWAVELCALKMRGRTVQVFERIGGGRVALETF